MYYKKIGMRTWKTAIAVVLTLIICELLKIDNPFFAVIAAIIAMESTVSGSLATARDRMYGTVFGAALGTLFSSVFPVNALTTGLGIMIVIYVSTLLGWEGTIKISTIVFIAVLLGFDNEMSRLSYGLMRMADTFIGLVIGTLINYYVFPLNLHAKLKDEMLELETLALQLVATIAHEGEDPSTISIAILGLKNSLDKVQSTLVALKSEPRRLSADSEKIDRYNRHLTLHIRLYHHACIVEELILVTSEVQRSQNESILHYHKEIIKSLHI
jgi:uncharacterized membrane protein YgaE (UPF0421/DUF939 family)